MFQCWSITKKKIKPKKNSSKLHQQLHPNNNAIRRKYRQQQQKKSRVTTISDLPTRHQNHIYVTRYALTHIPIYLSQRLLQTINNFLHIFFLPSSFAFKIYMKFIRGFLIGKTFKINNNRFFKSSFFPFILPQKFCVILPVATVSFCLMKSMAMKNKRKLCEKEHNLLESFDTKKYARILRTTKIAAIDCVVAVWILLFPDMAIFWRVICVFSLFRFYEWKMLAFFFSFTLLSQSTINDVLDIYVSSSRNVCFGLHCEWTVCLLEHATKQFVKNYRMNENRKIWASKLRQRQQQRRHWNENAVKQDETQTQKRNDSHDFLVVEKINNSSG